MHNDAKKIISGALQAVLPDAAVRKALRSLPVCSGKMILIAAGKAAWQMAAAAYKETGSRIHSGVVITKYGHAKGKIGNLTVFEAGHPVPDENSYRATQAAIDMVSDLTNDDLVLFLLSGGGSALFEKPLIPGEELQDITAQLLACGADIVQINTIRKRLSGVKGGRFAGACAPAQVFSVVLSDIVGDPLDMIASGPAYPDASTAEQALTIAEQYNLKLSPEARTLLSVETPKALDNVQTHITGSVRELCAAAAKEAEKLGYESRILTTELCCEARDAGIWLSKMAREYHDSKRPMALIAGGETVVHLTGRGKGGRNQEIALSAASGISGLKNTLIFSLGSDGTDGPTDAAGGIVDGNTLENLTKQGIHVAVVLAKNDSYNALKAVDGLIFTGPTGTNVNDLSVVLIKG